jgi:hypothetical protein
VAELELTRSPDDRRLYSLDGLGTVRLEGFTSRTATARAGANRWQFAPRSLWRRPVVATDEAGAEVGVFEPNSLRRGGALRWGDRSLVLRAASSWRDRYALVDGEREIALLDGKSWSRTPVRVTVDDAEAVEPGLLLFAAFVARRLADDAGTAAAVAASTAATGG